MYAELVIETLANIHKSDRGGSKTSILDRRYLPSEAWKGRGRGGKRGVAQKAKPFLRELLLLQVFAEGPPQS